MLNFDCITKEDIKNHNPNRPEISNHLHHILKLEAVAPKKQMHY